MTGRMQDTCISFQIVVLKVAGHFSIGTKQQNLNDYRVSCICSRLMHCRLSQVLQFVVVACRGSRSRLSPCNKAKQLWRAQLCKKFQSRMISLYTEGSLCRLGTQLGATWQADWHSAIYLYLYNVHPHSAYSTYLCRALFIPTTLECFATQETSDTAVLFEDIFAIL